jgi:hypothetical protein
MALQTTLTRRVTRWILLAGAISIFISLLAVLSHPMMRRRGHGNHSTIEAISNLQQIGLNLFFFEEDYGRFPDATTIPAVRSTTGTSIALGSGSSNQLFRQLLATVGKSEKIYWARTPATPRRPDDILGANALIPGECAFTYIAGLTSAGDPETPVLMAPVLRGTLKFDPKPFDGKAVVLFVDGSATRLPIDKNGDVILNGMNLFDPRQPFWRGKAPDIKYPE